MKRERRKEARLGMREIINAFMILDKKSESVPMTGHGGLLRDVEDGGSQMRVRLSPLRARPALLPRSTCFV
jgi:hypothetical protein